MQEQDFPLPDYDQLSTGSLQHMVRSLGRDELTRVLDYEQEHNNRPQVVEIMTQRLEELDRGAEPAPGEHRAQPAEAQDSAKGSPVAPSGSPQPMHPPRHGNQETPGKPKGERPF
ncbi:hypothetical protein EIL87_13010 [Saccharopolyspora rhizosphaerae]|uniref:DUF8129 domain-containing protein n=1 Tax=Saccharopolyspora rhizosphaerae TaxID=2492662 RepID=A0A426JU76_9PSEU|nr:hypothetical protein [Saccharopolyspora rhizosphaerae]RRO16728.1 hypothetical protein EIL87_13010 [Saccharopolyspora rhizosphaerae]